MRSMYKYVLLTLICSSILLIPADFASGENFFNDSWLEKKLKAEREDISPPVARELRMLPEPPEQPESERPFSRLIPPDPIYKPVITRSDSINAGESRVKRQNEIPGLRVEKYYFIPLEEYLQENLDSNILSLWKKETKDQMENWSTTDEGGVSDLDFVIPVGKRFERIVGGKTNINIDGSQRIEFSGKSEYDEGVIETATTKNSTFPSLTMKQEPQFTIRGNIGDRITVDIKQDSEAGMMTSLEENISIKYQGEDRDIIKYIEAGNTSLSLKGATFAGYTGTHKGLFGIRSEAQFGPIELTAIASQEKGESNTKSFRGSAEEMTNQIKDYEYKGNTYFFLDFYYRENFEQARDSFDRIRYMPADSLAVFEVYINDGIYTNDTNEGTLAYPGTAYPMNMINSSENPDMAVDGFYHRLDPNQYYVNRELGFIQFQQRISNDWTVGVYMITQDGREFGTLSYDPRNPETTKNVFKLIKRKSQLPTDEETWDLEWKNVYDLGQRNIDLDALEIRIFRQSTDGVSLDKLNGIPYIQILGLDKVDESGAEGTQPDNKVDFNRGFVDRFRGELIFPLLRPFDSDDAPAGVPPDRLLPENERVPEIYDVNNRKQKEEETKYYIEVKTANAQTTTRVEVGFGGIIENSEEVLVNGKRLTRGTDYRINYMTGEVTWLIDPPPGPNDQMTINYQETGALQQMQKTLFGLRGEYDLFSDSRLGAVFLYNNESTKEKRVRLGSEPSRTMLFDADADLNFQPEFMRSGVDILPGVVADTPAKVRIQGEFARSMPNMNTHGEVYIDDYEGSQDTPIGIMRTNWTLSSKPLDSTTFGRTLTNRGRLQWYNPWDRIKSEDIWPNKETTAGENTVHVLSLAYGMSDETANPYASYAGVMNAFWGSGVDLSRARFLEIWARGGKGELKIDFGSISEDYFPLDNQNGMLDTEDKPIPGQGQGDGVLTIDEDTGLDGVFDKDEPGYSSSNPDPNGDNWIYNVSDKFNYSRLNNTEGNARDSDLSGVPDTEDINQNGVLDTRNSYYEYSISFEDPFDPYLIQDSVPTGNPEGWRLFRIPLWNNMQAIEDGTVEKPDSTLIEFARMWITGTDSTIIQIAEMKVIESNWLEVGILDLEDEEVSGVNDIVRISTKNNHENLEYTSPPGVKGELDRDTKIRRKEQSLVIEVENLDGGNTAFIYRNFEKMDFTDYTMLKMYVYGPDEFPDASIGESEYEFVARFGGDKNNYYEYRSPIYRGWAKENFLEIDFARCTELKLDPNYGISDSIAVADTLNNKIYTLKGKPSLNNVKIISFGLRNKQSIGDITTEIWLNELRLDNLRDMGGMAAKTDVNIDLSGFIQVTGKVVRKDEDFHGMNAKKGSGQDDTQWDTSIRMNIDRFAPKRWQLSIPVSASTGQKESLPRLKSGSDIILPEDKKTEYRAFSKDKKARISYKKGHDTTKTGIIGFVTNWAFEKISADYDWGESESVSPTLGEVSSNNQQLKMLYDVNPKTRGFTMLGWMPELPTNIGRTISNAVFNYTPSALNYSYVFKEKNSYKTDIQGYIEAPRIIKTSDEVLNFSYDPFKSAKYTFQQTKTDDLYLKKSEVTYKEDNKLAITGPEFLNITNKYNYNITYDEDNDPKFSLSSQLGSRTIKFNKSFSANASFAIDKFLEDNISGRPKPARTTQQSDTDRPTWGSVFGIFKRDTSPGESEKDTDSAEEETSGEEETTPQPLPATNNAERSQNQEPANENDEKDDGESIRTKVVMAISNVLSPITVEYKKGEQLNYSGIDKRPDIFTRLGSGTIRPPDSTTVVTSRNSLANTDSYNSSTNLKLPLNIGIRTNANLDKSRRKTSSALERREGAEFPNVTVNWNKVESYIPFIEKYVANMNLTSKFSISKTKEWQNDIPEPKTDRNEKRYSPLISVSAKILNRFDTSFALNNTKQENYDLSGDTRSLSLVDTKTTTTQVRYMLNISQGLPLFRNLKLKSNIDLTMEYKTSFGTTERQVGEEDLALIKEDTSGSFSMNANYSFSQKFRGGAKMLFSSSEDITKKVHKIREVSIWCELRF